MPMGSESPADKISFDNAKYFPAKLCAPIPVSLPFKPEVNADSVFNSAAEPIR